MSLEQMLELLRHWVQITLDVFADGEVAWHEAFGDRPHPDFPHGLLHSVGQVDGMILLILDLSGAETPDDVRAVQERLDSVRARLAPIEDYLASCELIVSVK